MHAFLEKTLAFIVLELQFLINWKDFGKNKAMIIKGKLAVS